MNPIVYNVCVLLGVVMIGIGTALYSVPAALIVTGALFVALTLAAVRKVVR
jgi:hypothetical protein